MSYMCTHYVIVNCRDSQHIGVAELVAICKEASSDATTTHYGDHKFAL